MKAIRQKTRLLIEDLAKGIYLACTYLLVIGSPTVTAAVGTIVGSLFGALICLLLAARRTRQSSRGKRGNLFAAIVLGLLDYPTAFYFGALSGFIAGLFSTTAWPLGLLIMAPLGILVGAAMHVLKRVEKRWARRIGEISLVALSGAAIWSAGWFGWLVPVGSPAVVALALVLASALFLVLGFAGRDEETELEILLPCLALSVALAQLELPPLARGGVVLLPLSLFIVYCERIRKHLVVFKHALRGLGHEQQGNLRDALWYYQQALAVDPKSELAITGTQRVHRKIDLASIAPGDDLLDLVDPIVCLERVQKLLSSMASDPSVPRDAAEEAQKLLDIVAYRRQDLPLTIGVERLRTMLAREQKGTASFAFAQHLVQIPPDGVDDLQPHEADALFRIWVQLLKHPLLVAEGSLDWALSEERLFALIAILTRRLRELPDDGEAKGFLPFVYDKLTWDLYENYVQAHPDDPMTWLDYRYAWEMARGFAGNPETVPRAVEFLRIAEHGLPEYRLVLWHSLGHMEMAIGKPDGEAWLRRVRQFALETGPSNLSDSQRDAYFETVLFLARRAQERGHRAEAIENYELYSDSPKSGIETLRILRDLYEANGDIASAIRPVEAALAYSLSEREKKHWLAEKARLYREVSADQVRGRLAKLERYFDFAHCFRKAKSLFDTNGPEEELLHYLDLASLGGKEHLLAVNYLLGRSHLRAGRIQDAALCLEAVRAHRPKSFASKDQEEAYFHACRLLGDTYLDTLDEPAQAIECYLIYKDYVKSGAETLYRLASAYERNGQPAHARKWYDMVLVYPDHPKAGPAREALARLKN
ncbi:MAG: hypothetical protein U1D30_19965 [Planctomycetota bacterium]